MPFKDTIAWSSKVTAASILLATLAQQSSRAATVHTVGLLSADLHPFCMLGAMQQDITPQS